VNLLPRLPSARVRSLDASPVVTAFVQATRSRHSETVEAEHADRLMRPNREGLSTWLLVPLRRHRAAAGSGRPLSAPDQLLGMPRRQARAVVHHRQPDRFVAYDAL
jgi:hypothetical protein